MLWLIEWLSLLLRLEKLKWIYVCSQNLEYTWLKWSVIKVKHIPGIPHIQSVLKPVKTIDLSFGNLTLFSEQNLWQPSPHWINIWFAQKTLKYSVMFLQKKC